MSVTKMLTIGLIAQQIRRPIHRVAYIVRTRRIKPIGWAGNARVFSPEAVKQIRLALHEIAWHRQRIREGRTMRHKISDTNGRRHDAATHVAMPMATNIGSTNSVNRTLHALPLPR
jgi:hypothetical protein